VKIQWNQGKVLVKGLDHEAVSSRPYKELVGGLIYVSTCTRPEVSFPVNRHAQHFSDPAERHFDSALKVLGYLKYHQGLWLVLRREDVLGTESFCRC
jgi:hypothetical protein